jgi:hypothetical protein
MESTDKKALGQVRDALDSNATPASTTSTTRRRCCDFPAALFDQCGKLGEGIDTGNCFCTAMKWHDCHIPGVGLPVRLARSIKWIKRQVDSGHKEGEIHYLTRKHHYGPVSRGSSVIVVGSRSGGLLANDLDQPRFRRRPSNSP